MTADSSHPADDTVLFHVGLHKTGTSWLQSAFFSHHPDTELVVASATPDRDEFLRALVLPQDGEFDRENVRSLFARARIDRGRLGIVSAERLSGHPIAGHYDRARLARRIADAFPRSRILVVVRDQVALVDSIYRQLVREGFPGSFDRLLERNWRLPGFNLAAYEFDAMLDMYWSVFSPERVLLLRHEQMRVDLSKFLREVEDFMGVPNHFVGTSPEAVNTSLTHREVRVLRRLNRARVGDVNQFPVISVPRPALWSSARALARVLPLVDRPAISQDQRQELATRYEVSNRRLAEMLDSQAPPWA